ncbi:hypothetical protein, partial [Actinotalea sp.]|uniref:hypothetical protein n=1 Tax=Actinotalea sp. TaxID=1872145 RepID=UPI003564F669
GSGGVPIVENEDATHVYSYGHVDPQAMADAVNAWDQEMVGDFSMDWRTGADEVQHAYAVTIKGAGDPEGWWMSWRDVTAETPGAFPISLVTR